MLTFPR